MTPPGTAAKANQVFDLLEKFAGYGFNKSHAAAYAIVAYQTAYLKGNHPVEFLCAMMTNDMSSTDKLAQFIQEARQLGIEVKPPDVNESHVAFAPAPGGVTMTDHIIYEPGWGPIGGLVDALWIRQQLATVFDFRARKIAELFPG